MKTRRNIIVAALLAAACLAQVEAFAATTPSAFSVQTVRSDAQISDQPYFDLRMAPGDKQTLKLQINNNEEVPIIATVELNPATTATNGTIVYNKADGVTPEMKIPVTEIAMVRKAETAVPAKSSAIVEIDVEMPDVEMDGVILGGLRVTARYEEEQSAGEGGEGIKIENRFAYVVGLKITQNETVVPPDFALTGIKPELVNYAAAVVIRIRNTEAAIAKDVSFAARVYKKGSATALRELVREKAEMAPNSECGFHVDWNNRRFEPGTYRAVVRMQHGDKVWEWDEEFTVEPAAADELNDGALGVQTGIYVSQWMLWAVGIPVLLLIIILAYTAGRRRRAERIADGA